jgi:hypothetical protein
VAITVLFFQQPRNYVFCVTTVEVLQRSNNQSYSVRVEGMKRSKGRKNSKKIDHRNRDIMTERRSSAAKRRCTKRIKKERKREKTRKHA